MKKILFLILPMMLFACHGKQKQITDVTDSVAVDTVVVVDSVLTVENLISMDRQNMFLNYANDYKWFETCIVLDNYLDTDSCNGEVASVTNIFQVIDVKEEGADVYVVMNTHTTYDYSEDIHYGFWLEDNPLNEENIKLTFIEAFDKLMQANCPKPHSRQCVLRKQIGPNPTNPQYIFGNTHAQVYVDATTGVVNTINPVFPTLAKPLGEWP